MSSTDLSTQNGGLLIPKKPTLAALALNPAKREEYDRFLTLINQPPPISWVKEHPFVKVEENGKKVPLKYIPIERVEMLLRQIFQVVNITVVDYKLIGNAVTVHVRLNVQEPVTDQWLTVDGVGAVALQVDKDAPATDFSKIKSSAVMMSLPAAKSYAIKDAAELLGKLFGADLNRKDVIGFSAAYTGREDDSEKSEQNMNKIRELLQHPNLDSLLKETVTKSLDKMGGQIDLQKRTIESMQKDIQTNPKL